MRNMLSYWELLVESSVDQLLNSAHVADLLHQMQESRTHPVVKGQCDPCQRAAVHNPRLVPASWREHAGYVWHINADAGGGLEVEAGRGGTLLPVVAP